VRGHALAKRGAGLLEEIRFLPGRCVLVAESGGREAAGAGPSGDGLRGGGGAEGWRAGTQDAAGFVELGGVFLDAWRSMFSVCEVLPSGVILMRRV